MDTASPVIPQVQSPGVANQWPGNPGSATNATHTNWSTQYGYGRPDLGAATTAGAVGEDPADGRDRLPVTGTSTSIPKRQQHPAGPAGSAPPRWRTRVERSAGGSSGRSAPTRPTPPSTRSARARHEPRSGPLGTLQPRADSARRSTITPRVDAAAGRSGAVHRHAAAAGRATAMD